MNEAADGIDLLGGVSSASNLGWPSLDDVAKSLVSYQTDNTGSTVIGVVDTVAVHHGPIGGIAVSVDGHRLMATNHGDDTVSIIDTATGAVAGTVFDADEPFAIATASPGDGRHSNRNRAYVGVASAAFDSVLAISLDTAEVVAAYPVASSIADLAVDPTGQRVYVARTGDSGVDVLTVDATHGPADAVYVSTVPGAAAVCVRTSPDGRRLYVAVNQPGGGTVTVLDAGGSIAGTIEVGGAVRDVAVSPNGDTILIATCDSDDGATVHVVDARANVTTDAFPVDAAVTQLTVSRDGERAYLLTADGVVVVCGRTYEVLGSIAATTSPSCMVESPDGSRLYVADYEGVVTVVAVAARASEPSLQDQLALDDAVTRMLALEPAV